MVKGDWKTKSSSRFHEPGNLVKKTAFILIIRKLWRHNLNALSCSSLSAFQCNFLQFLNLGLQYVHGISHDRCPCAAVLSHLDADRWPFPVPTSKVIDPGSSKKCEVFLDGPRPRLHLAPRRFRQVGNGVGQMTSRMISPGARLEACPNQRKRR